jgi:subtilisin family serine protease
MKVLNVLLLVLFTSSASARVGYVQQALEPLDGAIPDEYVVILPDGVEPRGLVNGLKMRLVASLKEGGNAEIIYDYTNINGFAVRMNLNDLQNALKNIEGVQISTNDVATSDLVQSPVASWGLDRVDQMTGGLALDNAYSYVRDGSNVDVYILDTGIFIEHTDFGGRARLGADFTGEGNFDGHGHGSHVAGTLAPIVIVFTYNSFSLFAIIRVPCSLLLAT